MKMKLTSLLAAGAMSVGSSLLSIASSPPPVRLTMDLAAPPKPISPELFGIFFEDLNYAADGGLYAELIQNRSFEYSATEQLNWGPLFGWDLVSTGGGTGELGLGDARPVHENNPHYLLLTVHQAGNGVGVANRGFDGIPVQAGKAYDASCWAYQAFNGKKWGGAGVDQNKPIPLSFRLEGKDGTVLAEARFEVGGRAWQKHTATLTPSRSDPAARFVLLMHAEGGLAVDMVSLFPRETFKGHVNGLRRDLAQTIADLHPKFVRFPGGCLVHGPGIHRYYDWKKTVGPVEQRKAERNSWGYHQTFGLGYFEFFQFCEDIGAAPLPVVSAGVCCQHAGDSPGRGNEGLPFEEMPAYIQDILDLIEWANGPATSKWGAVRAAAGHPAPFGLRHLGLGNEDAITPEFQQRYRMINDALKQRHPEITVIGTVGPFPAGEDFEKGWAFAREQNLPMVDEHYYQSPQWFWENVHRYDSYDRRGPQVYVGEYAAHEKDRRNTLRTALAEAAGCIGFEHNGDMVRLSSYAPLLGRRGHTQWTPDLIYFTGSEVFPSVNYQVQKLISNNSGDQLLPTTLAGVGPNDRLAMSAVRDSRSGDVIVKIVNGEDHSFAVNVDLASMSAVGRQLVTTILTGTNADVANEDGLPPVALPVRSERRVDKRIEQVVPANSLTVLRLRSFELIP